MHPMLRISIYAIQASKFNSDCYGIFAAHVGMIYH
jgi:hypothetical protein